jgi:hypothetical protein
VAVEGPRIAERLKRVKHRLVLTLLVATAVVVATLTSVTTTDRPAQAAAGGSWDIDTWGASRSTDNVILKWNEQLLSTIRAYPGPTGPTITARALGVLHSATYDAWAAYDPTAIGTRPDGPPQQASGADTPANRDKAISYAAYRVLLDLFPPTLFPNKGAYTTPDVLLSSQLYDPNYSTVASTTDTAADPAAVGNLAAKAVLDFRRGPIAPDARTNFGDGANQLGDDPAGTPGVRYSDTTVPHYITTVQNKWNSSPLPQPRHWQQLCVLTLAGVAANQPPIRDPSLPCPDATPPLNYALQQPLGPHWENVVPFGPLKKSNHYPELFQLPGPPNDNTDVATALSDTSNLSDAQKVKAEYWADGPGSVFPPGHMFLFAQALSRMRENTLEQDVKLFFILGNAMLDASISAWAAKYQYDFWRPTTAIREVYKGKLVVSWRGPGKGFGKVLGQNWMPYQQLNVVTPPFPEYVSGHSTFSAAGRTVLTMMYGNNDAFGAKVTIPARSSAIEPGVTPAKDMVLSWKTLTEAADEAGMSRRYGGIHFYSGDQQGRALGRLIGYNDTNWARDYYFKGSVPPPPPL